MQILINWILSAFAILTTAYLLNGVQIQDFLTALAVAIVLGIVNTILKPLLIFLTLPINILTLGLFTLVIQALLVMLTSAIVPGFQVENFWWALLFGVVLMVINWFIHRLFK